MYVNRPKCVHGIRDASQKRGCTLRNQACRDLSSCVRKQQKIPHFIDKTAQNQNRRAHPFGCLGVVLRDISSGERLLQINLARHSVPSLFVKVIPFPSAISSRLYLHGQKEFILRRVFLLCLAAQIFAARLSGFSSSAMMLMLRSSSAFICIVVISRFIY